jgi:branched-chain amino acid transport system permease protein
MNYLLNIAIVVVIYFILSASLNLILGYGGMFHMGHGAFFAIGAYAGALIAVHLGLPFLVEMLMGGLVAGIFGLVIGFPSIRLKGDYLSFCSFGFAVVVYTVIQNWVSVTNGPIGISGVLRPHILGIDFSSMPAYLVLSVIVCIICFFLMKRITDSPYGKSIEAVREDELAANSCGRNVAALRVQIFCLGAFFAGIAGVLYVHYMTIADPSGFTTNTSFILVSMVIIGGMGSTLGSILGAITVILLPQLLLLIGIPGFYSDQVQNIIYSLVLIIIVNKRPQGIFGKLKF